MKKLLLVGMIAISTLSITTISSVFANELKKNTAVVDNKNINSSKAIKSNDDIGMYELLLDENVSDRNGDWQSDRFTIPSNTSQTNIYFENNGKEDAKVTVCESSSGNVVYNFTVKARDEKTVHPKLNNRSKYYIRISGPNGGGVRGNLRVAAYI